MQALAHLEAVIDFPDEDLPPEVADKVWGEVGDLQKSIASHLNDGGRGERIRDGLMIAIVGPPNAGKSTLLNALAGREAEWELLRVSRDEGVGTLIWSPLAFGLLTGFGIFLGAHVGAEAKLLAAQLRRPGLAANGRYPVAINGDIAGKSGGAGAINDGAAADHEIMHGQFLSQKAR